MLQKSYDDVNNYDNAEDETEEEDCFNATELCQTARKPLSCNVCLRANKSRPPCHDIVADVDDCGSGGVWFGGNYEELCDTTK